MILSVLRRETGPLHSQIERTMDLPARLRSVDDYTALLSRFHGFYAPVERRLAGVVGYEKIGFDLQPRIKAPLLERDLLTLGFSPSAVATLSACDDLPDLPGMAAALGCLYVLEGATLGGQIIRREVERRFGLEPDSGCSFFSSYRERAGEMWKGFCGTLTAYAEANPGTEGPIVSAASATFVKLDAWMAAL